MCIITWELFHFHSESKIDWFLKQITLKHDVEYIYNTLYHYKLNIELKTSQKTSQKKKLNYKSLKTIWINNQKALTDNWNIDFSKLIEKVDYVIAPLYKTSNMYIVGIILLTLDNNIKKIVLKTSKQTVIYNFLSHVNSDKIDLKFNIIKGILNNKINQVLDKYIIVKYSDSDSCSDSCSDSIGEIKIYLKDVFCNIRNYFPQIKVEYIQEERNIFYKVFSKSSKSIILPTSLPATLSATS
jgi:hypothetical protein